MARRKTAPTRPHPADLNPQDKLNAIGKLRRRVADLESFQPDKITDRDDPSILSLSKSIDRTLEQIYGITSTDYARLSDACLLDTAGHNIYEETPMHDVVEGLRYGKERAIEILNGEIQSLDEDIGDLGMTEQGRARRAIGELDLHHGLAPIVEKYEDGHYADAVETACKILSNLVQNKSGNFDADGRDLMQQVFSPDKGNLKFTACSNSNERNEQVGWQFLYAGVMAALRNPRAHKVVVDGPDRAFECIAFVNFLAFMLEHEVM